MPLYREVKQLTALSNMAVKMVGLQQIKFPTSNCLENATEKLTFLNKNLTVDSIAPLTWNSL